MSLTSLEAKLIGTALVAAGLCLGPARSADAGDPQTRFLESCLQREALGHSALEPWIELFCAREAELRFVRYAVANETEQRAMLQNDCRIQELLALWLDPIRGAIKAADLRPTVERSCVSDPSHPRG